MNPDHFRRVSLLVSIVILVFCGCRSVNDSESVTVAAEMEVAGELDEFIDPFDEEESATPLLKVSDPLEKINRSFYHFNDKFYFWLLKPVSIAYRKVMPEPVRVSFNRFFNNLRSPVRIVNNILQRRFRDSGIETARLLINTTFGLGGFFDPAMLELELNPKRARFDQTLGQYGSGIGFYIHWPILGPSSLRGSIGMAVDTLMTPWPYLDIPIATTVSVRSFQEVNLTSLSIGSYEDIKSAALDPYVALLTAYYQRRTGDRISVDAEDETGGEESPPSPFFVP